MPKLIIPNDNIHWSVERPVLLGVVRDIVDLTQMSSETPINFFGPEGKRYQESSTIGDLGLPKNKWNYHEQLTVEVQEDLDVENSITMALSRIEHQPIFHDRVLDVVITPIYALTKVSINFKYRAMDLNQASRWRNNIIMQLAMMFTVNLHEVEYDYFISNELLAVISEVWRLREEQAGYGESSAEYFTKYLTPRAHLIASQNGQSKAWAVKEKQIEVQGYFDFQAVPEKPEKDGEHDAWVTTFSYIFQYQKPIGCYIRYPLVIHNQMVDEEFIVEKEVYDLNKQNRRMSWSAQCLSIFRSDVRNTNAFGYEGFNLPSFDDWYPSKVIPTTVKIITAQVAISAEDKRNLVNLRELGELSLHPLLLEWLESGEYQHVCGLYRSIIQVSVYQDRDELPPSMYALDAQLNVIGLQDLDLRKCYHVRVGLVTDLRYLKSSTLARIQQRPDVGEKLANAIDACIFGFCGTRPDISKQILSDDDYTLLTSKKLSVDYRRDHRPHFVTEMIVQVPHYRTEQFSG